MNLFFLHNQKSWVAQKVTIISYASYDRNIHRKVAPSTITTSNDSDSGDLYDFSGVPFDLEALRSEIYSYSDRLLQQSKSGGGKENATSYVYNFRT